MQMMQKYAVKPFADTVEPILMKTAHDIRTSQVSPETIEGFFTWFI